MAYKTARKPGLCLRFLDIEQPIAPQHELFQKDGETGLPKKISGKEQKHFERDAEATEKKREAKPQPGKGWAENQIPDK